MRIKKARWLEVFPLKEESLELYKKENQGESLLFWAFSKNLIDRQAWLDSAKKIWNLPVLKNDFFTSPLFFEKKTWKRHESWDAIPIGQFKDVTFLACIEPPEEEKEGDSKYQFVLVDDLMFNKLKQQLPEQEPIREGFEETREEVRQTVEEPTICTIVSQNKFDKLWRQVENYFSGSLVLDHKEGQLYASNWVGRIKIEDKTQPIASLTEASFFRMVSKNMDYHGFVVNNEKNQEILKKLGWSILPHHVTALPILNSEHQIQHVFVGISSTPVLREKLKKIKEDCLAFFKPPASDKTRQAA